MAKLSKADLELDEYYTARIAELLLKEELLEREIRIWEGKRHDLRR